MDRTYRPRVADELLRRAMRTSGAVQIVGPKWCGKTTSALQVAAEARYLQDPDQRQEYAQLGHDKPSLLLRGNKPLLLDEWQDVPQLWDAVRFAVDRDPTPGQFLLTGSAVPNVQAKTEIRHSGTGRFARLRMRPMSLFESNESSGDVSLDSLFDDGPVDGVTTLTHDALAAAIVRGGWPASVVGHDDGTERARDYVDSVIESDISRVDGVEKNPKRVRLLMRSLARNESTEATMTTLQQDMVADDGSLAMNTIVHYLNSLRQLYILDEQEAWAQAVRSKVVQRTKAIRRYCDPSLPAALLRLTADKLLADYNTFGLLFESLAIRDLRTYADADDATVYHYRDARGLECDAIIERGDGRWAAVEIKLSSQRHDEARQTLLTVRDRVRSQHGGPPTCLIAITSGSYAYRDFDGISWVPLGCLRP
jgi:predicted AAA+ superfamily ATPase